MTVRYPDRALNFEILQAHVESACREDPTSCVIAQAMYHKCGSRLLEILVLKTRISLIWSGGREDRYKTPLVLKEALIRFDETGEWTLPRGSTA